MKKADCLICLIMGALILSTLLVTKDSLSAVQDEVTQDKPLSIRLTLQYHSQNRSLQIIKQEFLDRPAPKNRKSQPGADEFLLMCENSSGDVLGRLIIKNPEIIFSDEIDYSDPNMPFKPTGGAKKVIESIFTVVIPYNEHLANIKLLKPWFRDNGDAGPLQVVGVCPIGQTAIVSQ